MRLILASASPRRVALLREAGYEFEVVPADVDESAHEAERADDYVVRVAFLKAQAVLARFPGCAVIAADTTVVIDSEMLGKPLDDEDARRMLIRLSGGSHRVLTGVVVATARREVAAVVSTAVRFAPMTADEVAWYVATGEPRDKAGAYAVQGLASRFVESVVGSYTNVVGLPVDEVRQLLEEQGIARADAPVDRAPGSLPPPIDRA